MTITIEVPEVLERQIARDAEREGRPLPEVALARLAEWYGVPAEGGQEEPGVIEAIEEGLADVAAGRTTPLEDYRREMEARHAASRTARTTAAQ